MKVLYVINSLTRDVAAGFKQDEHVQRAFRKLGWEVILHSPACAPGTGRDASRLRRRVYRAAQNILPARLSSEMRLRYTLHYDERSGRTIRRLIDTHKPDLLYERYAGLQRACMCAARAMAVPSVVQFHAPPEESPHYRASARAAHLLESRMLETAGLASVVAVVSDALAKYLADRGVPEDKILVLPNAIDMDRFRAQTNGPSIRASVGVAPDRCVVGYVGTMKPWQGCDTLPDVFASVKRRIPTAVFLIVGPFPSDTYRHRFSKLLREHGLHEDCHLTGPVRSDLVPGYIRAMDICVMADTTDYCSPMKLFEYGACARAVVMPQRSPILGVIRDGENGLLFDPSFPAEMAERIVYLADKPELRDSLGTRLEQDVRLKHTYVRNVERILNHVGLRVCGDVSAPPATPCLMPSMAL